MGPPSERDLADIGPGLVRWFRERHGVRSATLMSIERPAGYSSDTVLVDLAVGDTGVGRTESIVIRIAPPVPGTFLDYDLRAQAGAQAAAARVGLPVADPAIEPEVSWIGAPFMVMQRVVGHIISDFPLTDDWLGSLDDDGRSAVHATFIDTLATIHRAGTGDLDGVPHRDNEAELDHWAEYLEWSSGGSPVRHARRRPRAVPRQPPRQRIRTRVALGRRPPREHGPADALEVARRPRLGHGLRGSTRTRSRLVQRPRLTTSRSSAIARRVSRPDGTIALTGRASGRTLQT